MNICKVYSSSFHRGYSSKKGCEEKTLSDILVSGSYNFDEKNDLFTCFNTTVDGPKDRAYLCKGSDVVKVKYDKNNCKGKEKVVKTYNAPRACKKSTFNEMKVYETYACDGPTHL
jgi:hypothetical protein